MRTSFLFLCVILVLVTPAWADITLDFSAQEPQYDPALEAFAIPGFMPAGETGTPMLPARLFRVLLPPDTDMRSVTMEVSLPIKQDLPGTYVLRRTPVPASFYVQEMPTQRTAGWYPTSDRVVDIAEYSQKRKFKYLLIRYMPVRYRIDTQQACFYPQASIIIRFSADPAFDPAVLNDTVFADKLKGTFFNEADFWSAYQPKGPGPKQPHDYLIITTSYIQTNSTVLASFVTHKANLGYTPLVVTESTWRGGASTCDAAANNLRTYLKGIYSSYSVKYVLLIGDPDEASYSSNYSVPMKKCWPRNSQSTDKDSPTDYFYADLSGTWDLNSNGFYGEHADIGSGGIDRQAEVIVGRIPHYASMPFSALNSILQKTINYENGTIGNSFRKKMLIPGAVSNYVEDWTCLYNHIDVTQETWGTYWGEAVKSMASTYGCATYTLYEKSGLSYPGTSCSAPLTNVNVYTEWANGYGFCSWWGHGSQTGAYRLVWPADSVFTDGITQRAYTGCDETSWPTLFSTAEVTQLNNATPAMVVQVSCNNGYPSASNNLGYVLLTQGAIATTSASRVSFYAMFTGGYNWSTSTYASVGDNASYGYYIPYRVLAGYDTYGEANHWCRENFVMGWTNGSSFMNVCDFNVYGDPSVRLLRLNQPTLSTPSNGATGQPPTLTLYWSDTNSSPNESGYQVRIKPQGGSYSYYMVSANVTSYAPAGLSPNITYYWNVQAQGNNTTTFDSIFANNGTDWSFTTACTAPTVQTNAASNIGQTTAQLNGTVNPNGCLTNAWFEWGPTTAYGNYTTAQNMGSGSSPLAFSANLSGLAMGQTYHYRAIAMNPGGTVLGADQPFTTASLTPLNPPTLSSPSNGATDQSLSTTLYWTDTNSSPNETGYRVRIMPHGGSYTYYDQPANTTSFAPPGLDYNTIHYWDVMAIGDGATTMDSGYANGDADWYFVTVCTNTTADAGPDKLIPCGQTTVTIGGSPTASGGVGPYTYYWSPQTGLNDHTIANPQA